MRFEPIRSLEVLYCAIYLGRYSPLMTKKYVTYPVSRRDRAGNIMRGFMLGLAEFSCLGTHLHDLAGYPYESEADAIQSYWTAVGRDMWKAIEENELDTSDAEQARDPKSEAEG